TVGVELDIGADLHPGRGDDRIADADLGELDLVGRRNRVDAVAVRRIEGAGDLDVLAFDDFGRRRSRRRLQLAEIDGIRVGDAVRHTGDAALAIRVDRDIAEFRRVCELDGDGIAG